ncbi:UDP-N-acetylmuramoyl-L-alanine--D-glutamate ligase [Flavicella sediminum]|uniref:UDP-N-acetylmuramoyl-L-alanine--D-glutamate ligase n=1 Tax=Flavicella sediminum TaxID=2585141 RepID=UPI00111CD6FE|nr:UDP-N-acetylmuramoyl-L-alanine--D-glutamate ligase [Flavicella sediminum]
MKRLVILGGGESGVGTAILGKQQGFDVFVSDKGLIKKEYQRVLENNAIQFESAKHTAEKILNADVVMKSPGIPDTVPLVVQLREQGVSVVSEIEFAAAYTKATIIGITGSNGKTTTTMLTHHILKKAGFNVSMAGNIGQSFAQQVATENHDSYVLELSSFQLDGIENFAPHIAMITNITPDHLDRYEYQFENYIESKFLITKNQTEKDYLIYDADDSAITNWLNKNKVKAQLIPFSLEKEIEQGACVVKDKIQMKLNKETVTMDISKISIKGKHNTKNAMASSLAAQMMKARRQVIKESLEDFEGAEHRLEKVLRINGVDYINDSKATNVNATFYALECMEAPTVWILGGVDKGNDYLDLMPLVREKVKAIICLGVDNSKIIQSFGGVVDTIIETQGAEEAVKVAYKLSSKGDTVLLSPACASFDLFESYEDRGRQFKNAVRHL